MWDFVIALGLGIVASTLLDRHLAYAWRKRWTSRGIYGPLNTDINTALRLLLPALVAGAFTIVYAPTLFAAVYVAVATWMCIVSVTTDLATCKIPREPAWVTLAVGGIAVAVEWNLTGAASALVAFTLVGLVTVLTALVSRGGLGSGDVRLLLALTPLAAWVGFWPIFISLLVASLIQIPLRYLLKRFGNYQAQGLPFGPALVIAVVASIVLYGHPGMPAVEWLGIL